MLRMLTRTMLLLVVGVAYIANAYAGNTAVYGAGTRGETLQAFVAVADDPSAVYYNPAGLTQIKGTQVDTGAILILPNGRYTNSTNNVSSSSNRSTFAPNLFISSDHFAPITLGFGLYAPFAREANYTINPALYNLAHSSNLVRLDLVPTMAFHLTKNISLGASLVVSRIDAKTNIMGFNESGFGYGYTGQLGLLVKLAKNFKIGVDYRGPMKAHINGHGTVAGLGSGSYKSDVRFPGVLTAGFAWHFLKPLTLSFAYEYEMWSYVQSVQRNYNNPALTPLSTTTVNGRDVGNIRVGLMYRPNHANEYRIGYSYLPAAVPANFITPATPDFATHVASVGYSYYYKQWRFDAGYEFAYAPKRSSNSTVFPGNYSLTANMILFGFGYHIA